MYHNEKVQNIVSQVRHTGANIHERIARLERNTDRAAALVRARQRLGAWVEKEMPDKSLAALRMRAGFSQAKLAELMGTQQSNISRWEKAPGDMQHSTMKRLAQLLGVSTNEVVSAIENQERPQGEVA